MKRLTILIAFLLLVVFDATAADIKPARTKVNNLCSSFRLCDAEGDTGVCQDPTGTDEIVFFSGRTSDYTLYSTLSTSADYTCNIFTSSDGTPSSGTNDQVNTASITDEVPVYTMNVLLQYLWINCSAIDTGAGFGDRVTIDAVVCPRG